MKSEQRRRRPSGGGLKESGRHGRELAARAAVACTCAGKASSLGVATRALCVKHVRAQGAHHENHGK